MDRRKTVTWWVKIPGYMRDGNLRLRPLRIFDGPFICDGLRGGTAMNDSDADKPLRSSWFRIWRLIKRSHDCTFCIELDSKAIGLTGLYNLMPGESVYISLVLFDHAQRKKGYGARAFYLLARNLKKYGAVKRILSAVKKDNLPALEFWRSAGFSETGMDGGAILMSLDLNHCSSPIPSIRDQRPIYSLNGHRLI